MPWHEFIESVHEEMQQYRAAKGLLPWDFKKRRARTAEEVLSVLEDNMSRFFCKPCLDAGHQCYAIEGVNFESAEEAVCRFCDDKEPCPVVLRETREVKMEPANGSGYKVFDKNKTALAKAPPVKIAVRELTETENDMRDLMKVLCQTMAGVLTGTVQPAQANAVCNTASTVLKVATAINKLRE